MLTYQVRERIFRLEEQRELRFPCLATMRLTFAPLQPFGESAGGGRTAVQSTPAKALFDANTGQHFVESDPPLSPLEVRVEEPGRTFDLKGRVLSITQEVNSLSELDILITSVAFGMPWLLSVDFADPPYLERVDGEIDGVGFRWELKEWYAAFRITNQEVQEKYVAKAWRRFSILSEPRRRRLLAALHYFHVAARLERSGRTAGEFISEVLLNLCKVLESLFPGDPPRDAVRAGLRALGYDERTIERDLIPVMLLRSQIDVGHVQLAPFKRQHLAILYSFLQGAEGEFRRLLQKVLIEIEAGRWDVTPYEKESADQDVVETIETIGQALAEREREREAG